MKPRIPRADRLKARFPPLPLWIRAALLACGWVLVLLGVAGLFLPILQGALLLALGLALLSLGSEKVHLRLRSWMGRWPGLWKRLERLRRRLHLRLNRSRRSPDSQNPPRPPAET